MKVKELIDRLKELDGEMEIRVANESSSTEHPIIYVAEEAGEAKIEYRDTDE